MYQFYMTRFHEVVVVLIYFTTSTLTKTRGEWIDVIETLTPPGLTKDRCHKLPTEHHFEKIWETPGLLILEGQRSNERDFCITLEWEDQRPDLLKYRSQLILRKAVKKLLKYEATGKGYINTDQDQKKSLRQELLEQVELAEAASMKSGTQHMKLELQHWKDTLRESIRRMDRYVLEQLMYHPLVQFRHQKITFYYHAWLRIQLIRSKYRNTRFDPFVNVSIIDRFKSLPSKLEKEFLYVCKNHPDKRVYALEPLDILDLAKDILVHCNLTERIDRKGKLKDLVGEQKDIERKYWLSHKLRQKLDVMKNEFTDWVSRKEVEEGLTFSFPELALQIFIFCLEEKIKIKDLIEDPALIEEFVIRTKPDPYSGNKVFSYAMALKNARQL